ncbi:MAG: AbrB/MazE/SpoVT family DNA-binding domain-containing protein [Fervidicoccaceae archaeon]|nr:AbrB/MazE/SpoVT family DNA-binding domain-containing protein [Fervidicoccaceae archaeon]
METRKIQRLGSSSFIVTLPANWVRRYGLKAGDLVMVIEENGSLKIKPKDKKPSQDQLRINLRKISSSDFNDDLISCLLSLGFDSINIEYNQHLKSILEKLADKLDIDIKIKNGFIEISSKNISTSSLADDIKDMGKVIVSLIEELLSNEKEEINDTQIGILEKLLQIKFLSVRRKIFKELTSRKEDNVSIIATAEMYAIISDIYSLSSKLLSSVKILASNSPEEQPIIMNVLREYSDALWELFAGVANSSMKRIAYSKDKLYRLLLKINELNINKSPLQVLHLIVNDSHQLATKAEACIKTLRVIEENASFKKESLLREEIIA